MKKYINILFVALGLIFNSCAHKLDDVNIDLNANTDILSFMIEGQLAIIDNSNNTIRLELPGGTDLTALAPVIEVAEGATVTPSSGQTQNFQRSKSSPIEYKVVNGNMTNTYKVTVIEVRPKITRFAIGDYTVYLDDESKHITVYTNGDDNISSVLPVVEYTEGATLSPVSGTMVDLNNPVTYTLSYDGIDYVYTVTAITSPFITIYNGEDITPVWTDIAGWDGSRSILGVNVDNPNKSDMNDTDYCMSIGRKNTGTEDGGQPWSGGGIMNNQVNILPSAYGRISAKVLKTVAGPVTLELQGSGVGNEFTTAEYSDEHLGEWQELFFDLPVRTAPITSVLIRVHDTNNGLTTTPVNMYWDEMKVYPRGSLPQITGFSINGVAGVINQNERTITVDASSFADITALSPVITANTGASVLPASGAVVDFTGHPITYTATSAQGISVQYNVSLNGVPTILYNGETVLATWWDIEAWNNAAGQTLMGVNINNPDKIGVNTSNKCMSVPRTNSNNNEGGYPHSGAALWNEPNPQLYIDPALYGSLKLMIKKPLAGPVVIEIQDNNPDDLARQKHYLSANYTDVGHWQDLIFEIPADRTAPIQNILVRPHDTNDGLSSAPTLMYWDELRAFPR